MNFQNPPYTPAAASQRIRSLWRKFELSQTKDRAQLDSIVQAALEKADEEWFKSPINVRMSKIQRNANKAKIAKKIKAPYFDAARAKWHGMLEPLGLKPDYWTDLTEDEKRRITNALGAEDESDEDVVVPELPTPPPQPPIVQPPPQSSHFYQPLAPSFSTSSRATNLSSSSYAFVNPSEFNSEEEDFEFEIPFSNPVATSVDLTSEDDDDPVASIPNYPGSRASLLGSAFSRASLSASIPSNARPLVQGFAYNAAPTGPVPTKRQPPQPLPQSQVSQNEGKSTQTTKPTTSTTTRIPRQPYVGPSLDAPDEPIDEELEFEKFKMRTRMAKIVEFHEAAALAEISLSIEMYKARKQLNNSNEEDAPRVLEHQKRMLQLQKEKEEQRKAIVKSERARRQSELARRSSSSIFGDDDEDDDVGVGVVGKGLTPKSKSKSKSNGGAFKTWDPSSFQEEINLPSRFNLETLLSESDDPTNQQTTVESLLNEMFSDDYSASVNPNAPSLAPPTASAWLSSKDSATPVNGAWSSKKTSSVPQPRQGSNANNPDKLPVLQPPTVEAATVSSKASVAETTTTPSAVPPTPTPAPAIAPAPAGKKQTKKQRQAANKKGGGAPAAAAAPATVAAKAAIPEQEPETEPVLAQQQRESPTLESPVMVAAPNPITPQISDHASWLPPKTAMARARMESEPQPPSTPSFSWDETTSTPRPTSKIPAHLQESFVKSSESGGSGTLRPGMLRKKNLMAEIFSGATSSRTTLEQMPTTTSVPTTATTPIAKGPIWGSSSASASIIPTSVTPGPSLWGKTKADFENVKPAQQQPVVVGGDPWVPGGFEGVGDYKNEGDGGGGGGGGGNEGGSLWGSISSHSKQNGKTTTSIPTKQPVAAQRLRRVSEAAAVSSSSSPAAAPRGFGTKDLSSDIGKQQQQHLAAAKVAAATPPTTAVNSNSNKKQGKKNGKGKQRATIEVVSDDEKDNIDILPQDSTFIMEPKVILEPKPSVPSYVYNPIIDFTGSAASAADDGDVNNFNFNDDDMNDIAYLASTFRPTASSSSQDDFFSIESRFSNPFNKTTSQGVPASTLGAASADWGSTMGGGIHARWTPAVNNFLNDGDEEENSGLLPSFRPVSVAAPPAPPRLQQSLKSSSVQQTPIWGQPNPSASAKDKGRGKK